MKDINGGPMGMLLKVLINVLVKTQLERKNVIKITWEIDAIERILGFLIQIVEVTKAVFQRFGLVQ